MHKHANIAQENLKMEIGELTPRPKFPDDEKEFSLRISVMSMHYA